MTISENISLDNNCVTYHSFSGKTAAVNLRFYALDDYSCSAFHLFLPFAAPSSSDYLTFRYYLNVGINAFAG